ncbi:hypothetical protein CLU79DRAFT_712887, partial [Phycomyces nitens]
IKECFIRVFNLYIFDDTLLLADYSEAEILHDVWLFVYSAFKDKKIKGCLGKNAGVVVSLCKNKDRNLEVINKRSRKPIRTKLDNLFKVYKDELESPKVSKDCLIVVDEMHLSDQLIKLPEIL